MRLCGCRGPNYFEVDIDVSSSSVAKHVVGLVCGATKSVTVDLAILLQVTFSPPLRTIAQLASPTAIAMPCH